MEEGLMFAACITPVTMYNLCCQSRGECKRILSASISSHTNKSLAFTPSICMTRCRGQNLHLNFNPIILPYCHCINRKHQAWSIHN